MLLLSAIHISWATYAKSILLLLLVYWLFICLIYYRKELKALFSGRKMVATGGTELQAEVSGVFDAGIPEEEYRRAAGEDEEVLMVPFEESQPEQFTLAYELAEEIKAFIADAASKKMVKQELLQGIHLLLVKDPYAELNGSGLKNAINGLVCSETLDQCNIEIGEDEVVPLWNA